MITYNELQDIFPVCKCVARDTYLIKTSDTSEFDYYVNLKKQKITAILNEDDSLIEQVNAAVKYNDDYLASLLRHLANYSHVKFTGSTTCHAEDEFDIEKGISIAKAKALYKKYIYSIKVDKCIIASAAKQISVSQDRIEKCNKRIKNYTDFLNSVR